MKSHQVDTLLINIIITIIIIIIITIIIINIIIMVFKDRSHGDNPIFYAQLPVIIVNCLNRALVLISCS